VASRKTPSKPRPQTGKGSGTARTGSGKGKAQRQSAKERIAAARAAERRAERRRWIVMFAVVGVVVAGLVGGLVWAIARQNNAEQVARDTAKPPWPLPADPVAGAKAAGLDVQPMEGTAKHFHAHLDVLVNGKPIEVPANLGVDPGQQAMSELHTHDTRGVLHIEAPTANKRYNLGQVFKTWQVTLSATQLGGLNADGTNTLTAYVDGKKQTGDPAAIELTQRRQIALVYGPADAKVNVPSTYKFEPGE
jgi:hypothetical protein